MDSGDDSARDKPGTAESPRDGTDDCGGDPGPSARYETTLRAAGLRITRQRRIILGILAGTDDHPDATQLHARAVQEDPQISLATVYRTMKALEETGAIQRHAFDGGPARFEHAAGEHHDHLIDIDTGAARLRDRPSPARTLRPQEALTSARYLAGNCQAGSTAHAPPAAGPSEPLTTLVGHRPKCPAGISVHLPPGDGLRRVLSGRRRRRNPGAARRYRAAAAGRSSDWDRRSSPSTGRSTPPSAPTRRWA